MAFRHLFLASPSALSVKNAQLVVSMGEQLVSFPLEDLDAVMIEQPRTQLTVPVLTALARHNIAVFFCDEKHMPCCQLLPFEQHSRQLAVLRAQMAQTEPRKKRLWQQIVQQKIRNQAACLRLQGVESGANHLDALAASVRSGDTGNVEAVAAAYYFPALFGYGFFRGNAEDVRNAALNYGYAIVRGMIARTVTAYGFQPCLGLHHRSELNAYNLADDLIEPFRPAVDAYVAAMHFAEETLAQKDRQTLFGLSEAEMIAGGKRCSLSYAAELLVQSLLRCLQRENAELQLPVLAQLTRHRYE